MLSSLPGIIMGFREGLEAFLVVAIIIQYLGTLQQNSLKQFVAYGAGVGVAASFLVGWMIYGVGSQFGNTDLLAKAWESMASLVALGLVTTFILWMINHGKNLTSEVRGQVEQNLSKAGVFFVAATVVAREGVEIAIFAYAGKYAVASIGIGLAAALVLAVGIFFSLVRINIGTLFRITIMYLILQSGYLLGYGIHEGLSALKDAGYLAKDSVLLVRAFDFSKTILNHKDGILGLPLNVLLGWYSRPEWLQLIAQYGYTAVLLTFLQRSWDAPVKSAAVLGTDGNC